MKKIGIQRIEILKFQGHSIDHEIKLLKKDYPELIFEKKPKLGESNIQCIYSPPGNGKERNITVDYSIENKEHCFIWKTKKCSLILRTTLPFDLFERIRVAKWKD